MIVAKKSSPIALLLLLLWCTRALPGVAAPGAATEVNNLRIGLTPERTRVVFDLSAPADYKLEELDNPPRIIIDLSGTSSAVDDTKIQLQGTPISRIHSEAQGDSPLRYVFDLTQDSKAVLFTMEPHLSRGHRLVLDLYPPESARQHSLDNTNADTPAATTVPPASGSADKQNTKPLTTRRHNTAGAPNPAGNDKSGEWSGYFSLDARLFFNSPEWPDQEDQNASIAFQPEYYRDWARGRQQFAFSPFLRYDANDDERTHADIRELYWRGEFDRFAVKAGADIVFWGVTESQHLVDIINQTDLVENIDGEDKLGQPMLNLDYLNDWGSWQFYLLPYFRERTFPGEDGRLRTHPPINNNDPEYESGSEEKHIDFALRWSQNIGDWDIGLAHFSGTSREPLFLLEETERKGPHFIPLYLQIDQTSVDLQATKGTWLWKLESIYNHSKAEDYYAYVGGFEYTYFGVADSAADLGFLLEYNYDERGDRSTNAMQDDIYLGLRLTGNDLAGTNLLTGVIVDTDSRSTIVNFEATRRLSESWTLAVDVRVFTNIDQDDNPYYTEGGEFFEKNDNLFFIREDDYIEIQLFRYF